MHSKQSTVVILTSGKEPVTVGDDGFDNSGKQIGLHHSFTAEQQKT